MIAVQTVCAAYVSMGADVGFKDRYKLLQMYVSRGRDVLVTSARRMSRHLPISEAWRFSLEGHP
jgi:hypothetical protein